MFHLHKHDWGLLSAVDIERTHYIKDDDYMRIMYGNTGDRTQTVLKTVVVEKCVDKSCGKLRESTFSGHHSDDIAKNYCSPLHKR